MWSQRSRLPWSTSTLPVVRPAAAGRREPILRVSIPPSTSDSHRSSPVAVGFCLQWRPDGGAMNEDSTRGPERLAFAALVSFLLGAVVAQGLWRPLAHVFGPSGT